MVDNYPYVGWVYRKKVFDTGKTPVTRITLTCKKYVPGRNGEQGKLVPSYVTCVAFGKSAEMLAKVKEKAVLFVVGEPVAGKPYEKDGQHVSQLEIKISKWSYVDLPEGAASARTEEDAAQDDANAGEPVGAGARSGSSTGAAYGDDPFQDEY